MPIISTRTLVMAAVVLFGGASVACVDQARCDVALEQVAEARAEAAQREQQIAWLAWSQAQLAAQVQRGAAPGNDAEREALRQRVALLEAENTALAARIEQAERRLAAEGAGRGATARRRLDPAVPYALAGFLVRPRDTGKQEASLLRRATRPSRRLDPMVPYEPEAGAATPAPTLAAAPARRTLDEDVPY